MNALRADEGEGAVLDSWGGLDGESAHAVGAQNQRLLETYRADPNRLEQDANIERSIAEGGYAARQIYELLQNAADALRDEPGHCAVVLTSRTLYVANAGTPLSIRGIEALMASHMSAKRDDQIGRFGLGFKSVFAVSDSPAIYSRSGSLRFSRERSHTILAHEFPTFSHYPTARLAEAVDPMQARAQDPELERLMRWATTIVVLPLRSNRDELADQLRIFPAEFLLFSPQVTRLTIHDRELKGVARRITLERDGNEWILNDADRRSRWIVSKVRHTPTPEALRDGGYHAAREEVEVSWAAAIEGAPRGIGRFWAYFPMRDETTLSGIVNAPWKLADDRESLLDGPFNREMLVDVLPHLVKSSLNKLAPKDRPAAVLDALPARGKEKRNFADQALNQPVMQAVADAQSIPNMHGDLRHPTRIRLHPDAATPDELKLWASVVTDPEWWVHHSVNNDERRAKVMRLMALNSRVVTPLKEWIEALVREPSVETSAVAVQLVARILKRKPELRDELTAARVLLLENGRVVPCQKGKVFVRGGDQDQAGRLFIDPVLAADPAVEVALSSLGIELLDDANTLRAELNMATIDWGRVWTSSRRISVNEAYAIFQEVLGDALLARLRVRSAGGKWVDPGMVYLPGEVIPEQSTQDRDYLVDPLYHKQDLELLRRLGLTDRPRRAINPPLEAWRRIADEEALKLYRKKLQTNVRETSVTVDRGLIPWPLEPLSLLSMEARLRLTMLTLKEMVGQERWHIAYHTGANRVSIANPVWARLRRHGVLETQAGIQPISRCIAYDEETAVIDGALQPLPIVQPTLGAEPTKWLHLASDVAELKATEWNGLIQDAGGWEASKRTLLYAWAAHCGHPAPSRIKVSRGLGHVTVPPNEAAVTDSEEIFHSLITAECAAILASTADAEILKSNWGLLPGEDMLVETLDYQGTGERSVVIDRFPPLRNSLEPEYHDLEVQLCTSLTLLTSTPSGQRARPLTEKLDGKLILSTAVRDADLLNSIGRSLGVKLNPPRILAQMRAQQEAQLRRDIANLSSVEEKLVTAVGEDALAMAIPVSALSALQSGIGRELKAEEFARLALAVDGYSILKTHAANLRTAGLEPPTRWAGSRQARDWVRSLGFPIEYAGLTGEKREPEIEVEGPPKLGNLHGYQRRIADNIKALLEPTSESNRGLVSLPTGAGKTRIAVQALVEYMLKSPGDFRIVWLAETDELCEQAVQTWSRIWRAEGDSERPLTLSRLWGGNEANERDGFQVVVASIAKLNTKVTEKEWVDGYRWLAEPSVIVVDEAHRSIAESYTNVLGALGSARSVSRMSTPLIGLSATPFRGFNNEETDRLAARYHRNLLDEGAFPNGMDVYAHLQEQEVLSHVRHQLLRGSKIELTLQERDHATKFKSLPDSVAARLGEDESRNNEIISSIRSLDRESSVLVFATSVENARVLAALLSFEGIESRAVSGNTDHFERRRYIEDFKAKRVRVLTNYNVFTEGFDVPKVDAVYVTRPTFSPNVYQQMVGRGLRGPLNGGSREVLVVNVDDNFTNFGEALAFRHFEHLWNRGES